MNVKWLLERMMFDDDDIRGLKKTIEDQGMDAKVVGYVPFNDASNAKILNSFKSDDWVVVHGSLNLAKFLSMKHSWIPGVYYTMMNYNCSTYYNYFGKFLLNEDYGNKHGSYLKNSLYDCLEKGLPGSLLFFYCC